METTNATCQPYPHATIPQRYTITTIGSSPYQHYQIHPKIYSQTHPFTIDAIYQLNPTKITIEIKKIMVCPNTKATLFFIPLVYNKNNKYNNPII